MTRARDLGDFIADGAAPELVVDTTTLVVDSTNNRVGIGTASPSQALDVSGTGNFTAVTAGTLTVDDITINGSTISDGADLTIDVGGDLIIDVDGADVKLKDGGTEFAHLFKSGNNFGIYSAISDGDIQFIGIDGGSQTTALTLDMSDAGTAIFNHDVKVNDNSRFFAGTSGDLEIYHDGSNSYIDDSGTGNLNIRASANVAIDKYTGEAMARFYQDAGVYLYYDNAAKFDTTAAGINVTGNITVTGTVDGIDIAGNINQAVKTTSSPQFANVYVDDKIYHHADSDTYINFGTDTVQVYAGGSYAQFSGGMLLLNDGSLAEDYDALSGTTPTIDVTSGGMFSLTTSGNTTFTFSGASSGYVQGFTLQLTAGGTHTITYPNSVDFAGGSAPDAPASGETDILVFITRDGGTTWYGALAIDAAG